MIKNLIKESIIIIFGAIIIVVIFSAVLVYYGSERDTEIARAASGDNVFGWAWNDSTGWISLNSLNCDIDGDGNYEGANEGNPAGSTPAPAGCPTSGAVTLYGASVDADGNFSGYAWSEAEGYIWFASTDIPPGETTASSTRLNVNSREIFGWARICSLTTTPASCTGGSAGWIRMRAVDDSYGVSLDKSNNFIGYAWSEDIGWISFSSKNCDADGDGQSDGSANCPPAGTPVGIYKTGIITNISGFAYSSNYDWFSFNCNNPEINGGAGECGSSFYGVNAVGNDTGVYNLGGYAWNPNIGWLSFEESNPPADTGIAAIVSSKCDSSCVPASGCTACFNKNDNKIYGGAKVLSLGDDGWVRLDDDDITDGINYGVTFASPNFHGYGWDGDGGTAGIGWLSFNCKEGAADGSSVCTADGGTSDYKVTYTEYFNFNHRPTVTFDSPADDISFSDLCTSPLSAILRWTFHDQEDGDGNQTGCNLQIKKSTDAWSSPVVDYSNPSSHSGEQYAFTTPIELNTTYNWRVEVFDSQGVGSGWNNGNDFSTPANDYPAPYFTWTPHEFSADEDVKFIDGSTCYDGSGDCSNIHWEFSGTPTDVNDTYYNASTTIASFPTVGEWAATSTITDSNGYACSTTTKSEANLKLPSWIESN